MKYLAHFNNLYIRIKSKERPFIRCKIYAYAIKTFYKASAAQTVTFNACIQVELCSDFITSLPFLLDIFLTAQRFFIIFISQ